MFNFKPKEDKFFELFIKAAQNANFAALALQELMHNYERADEIMNNIVSIESKGDAIKYEIEKQLLDTFITPFDREDIYRIAEKTDRFVNSVQSAALRFKILHVKEITDSAREIAAKIVFQSELLIKLMENLSDKRKDQIVKDTIVEMNKAESDVDRIFRDSMSNLFENPQDLLNVIVWKDVYQYLEDTSDACEEVANCIKGVVTKNE